MKRTVLLISAVIALIAATFQVVVAAGILPAPALLPSSISISMRIPSMIVKSRSDYDLLPTPRAESVADQLETFRAAEIGA